MFENSFNRYLTDEEIEDGVTPAADTGLPQRKYGTDVASKAATERATAMAVEADKVEFTNCAFLGSQDTLYTGNSATSLYFKNCRIEGNTDYIFGDGDCVFDGCELNGTDTVPIQSADILQHTNRHLIQKTVICSEIVLLQQMMN